MANKRKYTDKELKEVLANSISINSMLPKLGLKKWCGNWATVKERIKKLGLDSSHLLGMAHAKGRKYHQKSIFEYLKENGFPISTHNLKTRLINEEILENKCSRCGITEWEGEKLSLHLDHKNGKRYDNRKENLRLLCPNCHSLTPTYCGKNRKKSVATG